MFFTLILESIHLTNENASLIFNREPKLPVFIKLWASWCPHCKKFAPTWDEFANSSTFNGQVIIADIECEKNRQWCKKFPGQNFPRVYWLENETSNGIIFEGERTVDHLNLFVRKQLNFPLIVYQNETEIHHDFDEKENFSVYFVFKIPQDSENYISVAKSVAESFRDKETPFLLITSDDQFPHLYAHIAKDTELEYDGKFTISEITNFVIPKSIAFMEHLNAPIMKQASHGVIVMMRSNLDEMKKINETQLDISIGKTIYKYLPVTVANCVDELWLCNYCDLDHNSSETQYLVFNRPAKIFWVYKNKISETLIEEWVHNVRDGKVKGSGPGTGLFSVFLESYYNEKADGNAPPKAVLIIGPFLLLSVFMFGIYDMYRAAKSGSNKHPHKE